MTELLMETFATVYYTGRYIYNNIYNKKLKKAEQDLTVIKNKVKSSANSNDVKEIISSYDIMARKVFLASRPYIWQEKNDDDVFKAAINHYWNSSQPFIHYQPYNLELFNKKYPTLGVDNIKETALILLAIINYLKEYSASSHTPQQNRFLEQAHDFILLAYITMDSTKEYSSYSSKMLYTTLGAYFIEWLTSVALYIALGGAMAGLVGGPLVAGLFFVAVALVMIVPTVIAGYMIARHEKQQLEQCLTNDGAWQAQGKVISQMDSTLKEISAGSEVEGAKYAKLNTVLNAVYQAENRAAPYAGFELVI